MKLLITAFDAFGGEEMNVTSQVLQQLPNQFQSTEIIKIQLPTVFNDSAKLLLSTIKQYHPDIVICLGQAKGSPHISIERVAINIDDARIADNKGQQPIDKIIQKEGPVAYFSTLPIKRLMYNLQQNNIPTVISNSAGTFVCNHIMYQLLHFLSQYNHNIKGGFIHLPVLPAQVIQNPEVPSMTLDVMLQAILYIIKTLESYYYQEDMDIQ